MKRKNFIKMLGLSPLALAVKPKNSNVFKGKNIVTKSRAIESGESFIHNCIVKSREKEEDALFTFIENGKVILKLDGYAIIPKEEFVKMVVKSRNEKEYKWMFK